MSFHSIIIDKTTKDVCQNFTVRFFKEGIRIILLYYRASVLDQSRLAVRFIYVGTINHTLEIVTAELFFDKQYG